MFNRKILSDVNPFVSVCLKTDVNTCPPKGGKYPQRCAKSYELEFIVWSEGGVMIIDGEKYQLKSGDLIFKKPGTIMQGIMPYHYYNILFGMVYAGKNFFIDPVNYENLTEQFLYDVYLDINEYEKSREQLIFPIDFPSLMNISKYSEIKKLFEDIYSEYVNETDHTYLFSKSCLLRIFTIMYDQLSATDWSKNANRSIRSNYHLVQNVKNYIDSNIRLRFNLSELASMAGLSPGFFCKIFKKIIGQTPIDYINKRKIKEIENVLAQSNKEIKEICFDYGFESESYFFNVFKKANGLTPSAFRNIYRTSHENTD